MPELLFEDEIFEREALNSAPLPRGRYIDCTFNHGDFDSFTFNNYEFIDCTLNHCNWALAKVDNTRLKGVTFNDCKLTGVEFNLCDDFMFAVTFNRCIADYSSFYKKQLKKTSFIDCSLMEVDFTEADLTAAVFKNCNLKRATFRDTILEKADLSTAYNFIIDPELNRLKKARFAQAGLAGLLGKYNIEIV